MGRSIDCPPRGYWAEVCNSCESVAVDLLDHALERPCPVGDSPGIVTGVELTGVTLIDHAEFADLLLEHLGIIAYVGPNS